MDHYDDDSDNPQSKVEQDPPVGYCSTPIYTRYKKGQSGNPKGRPKGSRNFSTDARAILKEPVKLAGAGKQKTVSSQAAALMKLREKALKGDANALNKFVELARTYNDDELAVVTGELDSTDAEILAAHNKRVLLQSALPEANAEACSENNEPESSAEQPTSHEPTNSNLNEEEDDDDWLN